jgi:hypothetical protein
MHCNATSEVGLVQLSFAEVARVSDNNNTGVLIEDPSAFSGHAHLSILK